MNYLFELKNRSEALFYFGMVHVALAIVFIFWSYYNSTTVAGTNSLYKPFKFSASIAILSLTVAWLVFYIKNPGAQKIIELGLILTLGFEIIYISWQALQGQASHFNVSTPFHSVMYGLMAAGASGATLIVALLAYYFFSQPFPDLHPAFLMGIRAGLVIFVVFSFQGFAMGSRMAHTVGAPDGGVGISVLNWSKVAGDLRIAHFLGMHALQILPLVSVLMIKNSKVILGFAILYTLFCIRVLVLALQGKPFF